MQISYDEPVYMFVFRGPPSPALDLFIWTPSAVYTTMLQIPLWSHAYARLPRPAFTM